MKKGKKISDFGFTLIEVMIAIFILAMGFATTVGLMKWTIRGTLAGNKTTNAMTLAQDKLENLMRQGYDAIATGSDTTNSFTRSWTVTTSGSTKTIAVTVSWTSLGESSQVSVNGMVFD